ncbi:MoaF N-terminal domain-containing protein [Amycolatopsis rhabdoformis]|uniref:MoaF N-terminal domain-containing protein n=1 Tax=Amycolatopsis rhabdoformis TaxID=1448059 RepID=A0ABZ1I915_9PSEU|nr:MoaF N-terminal domain-containing protein [Amycolatopsis rhabdoformis]WSE29905.1 MoaF N-terminal domain-containing protein [Amycolatopsis rhabdoformis]
MPLHFADGVKAAPSTSVAGREIVFTNSHGSRVAHRFADTTVDWSYEPAGDDPHPVISGRDDYEAFDVAEGLVYTQFHHREAVPNAAVSLVLDFTHGRSLAVVSRIEETQVQQAFLPGRIEGFATLGPQPAHSTALVGRRVRWTSGAHRCEHDYHSAGSYTWRCSAGATDHCTTYQLRPGISVFAAREKSAPSASVSVIDHRDSAALRSYGAVFGLDEGPTQLTFGAAGELLGEN